MKRITAVLALFFCLHNLQSQSTLYFCGGVSPQGDCIYSNNKFFFVPDSTYQRIFLEVHNPQSFTGTGKITFKFYSVDTIGEEKYVNSADQEVKENWYFAWLPHVFTQKGKYDVKVYNDKEELMCNKQLEFF